MAGMRMSMRKIREVLRLTHELGLSVRQVREATGVGKTAVCEYVNRARVIGITWPIPPEITDAELERRLFTPAGFHEGSTKPLPDWTKVHQELKRRDADDPVGRASRRACRGPRIFPLCCAGIYVARRATGQGFRSFRWPARHIRGTVLPP
jgi:hypothetical protein